MENLIYSPHPLLAANGRRHVAWRPGDSVAEILGGLGIGSHVPLAVAIDGRRIESDDWRSIFPHAGQTITVRVLMHDGGGRRSNPIATVLSIALSFAAPGLGEMANLALFEAESALAFQLSNQVLGGIIGFAGNALIGAVFKPHTPAISQANGIAAPGASASPSYSLTGSQNRLRPFEPLPLVYGRHRLVPDLASRPYTLYSGTDQYLRQIFNCGLSDLVLSDWKIGDTALSSYSGWLMREANPDGRITGFHDDVDTLEGATLAPGVYLTRTLPAKTEAIQVDIQGTLFGINSSSGALEALACDIEVQYRELGVGSWVSMVSGSTTAAHTHYWSAGYNSFGSWVQAASGTTNAGEHIEGTPYTPPAGSTWAGNPEAMTWHWLAFGDATHISAAQKPAETYTVPVAALTLSSSSRDTIRRTAAKTDLDSTKTWEVRVRRTTAAYGKTTQMAEFSCPSIRAFQKVDYANVHLAGQRRLGLSIKATGQLNGMVDALNCIASARVRTSTSPTAAYAESSNPAWIFLDFCRGRSNASSQRMYGVGIADARLDLTAIAAWATFCTDNSLEFNGIFDARMSCAEVLKTIARCGRASITWNTGKLGVVWDAANQPVSAVFGMANIRAGSFKVQYATAKLADEVVVNFINRDRNWQRDTLRKARPGVANPTNPVELEIFGCTSEDQAGREAALLAAGQEYRRRILTWEADVEGLTVTRGDVVMLSHDLTQWGYSGRVVAFESSGSVRINKTVPVAGGDYLMLRAPDGTMTTLNVTNAVGETDLLTGTLPAYAGTTGMDWLWFFGPTATPGKKVKVTSIEPLDDLHVRMVAVDEEAGYYAAEADPWSYTPPESVSLLAPRVTRLAVTESITQVNGAWLPKASIDWSTENAASAIVVVMRNGSVIYNAPAADDNTHLDYTAAVGDVFAVTVTPISMVGIRGTEASASGTMTGGNVNAPPASIPRVNATYEGQIIWLEWDAVSDYRGISYEVRWGESWGSGVSYPVGSSLRFKTIGDGNYWVKAKTNNGAYSATAMGIRVEGSALVDNVIATLDESGTGWIGDFENCYKTPDGKVSLTGSALFSSHASVAAVTPSVVLAGGYHAEAHYTVPDAHVIDLGTPGACQVTAALTFDVKDPSALFSSHASIAALPSIKCPAGGSGSVDVEMNLAQADGVYSGWQPFKPGTYLARLFDFRLRLTTDTPTVAPFVDTWQLSVDVPDRIDSAEVVTPAGALAVTFATPFRIAPKIQATIQNAVAGDDIVVTSITTAGMTLTVKNGGSNVARTIHYLAQGY